MPTQNETKAKPCCFAVENFGALDSPEAFAVSLLSCSVEGEAPSSETGTSLDSPSGYPQGPITHSSALSPEHYEHPYGLYSIAPGQQRARRPKLQHSTSILRKQAEEEAIKRSRSLSESYELSSDLQDKQVFELVCVCELGEFFSSIASVGTFKLCYSLSHTASPPPGGKCKR